MGAAWCWATLPTCQGCRRALTLHKMLSHLKSRNGYGLSDINPKDEEGSKKEVEERTAEPEAYPPATVVADESSEAADSSVNSEVEDIEISADDEPEPGTDGSTYSEEDSGDEKEVGEKRKRDSDESDEDYVIEEELRSGRKAKRTSKGRGWGWLLDDEREASDSDYTPEGIEADSDDEVIDTDKDPDFGKSSKSRRGGGRGRGREKNLPNQTQ